MATSLDQSEPTPCLLPTTTAQHAQAHGLAALLESEGRVGCIWGMAPDTLWTLLPLWGGSTILALERKDVVTATCFSIHFPE